LADRYFNGSPIGYHFLSAPGRPPSRIIGVVGDAREGGIHEAPAPIVYGCYGVAQPGNWYLVRTKGEPSAMTETIRRELRGFESSRSMYSVATLDDRLDDTFKEDRLRTFLLVFFAVTAVSLACVGLYGMLSYMVQTQRREVGLRLALGAMRGEIVRRFLARGLALTLAGCAAGALLAAAFVRVLAGMLHGVSPADAWAWASVIAIIVLVAALASLAPAIRAARLDPMRVLREE
jgi:predicted lysophospholipase L1 biosynthesis ABC-type transport system permease subunit